MAILANNTVRTVLQIVLAIAIVVLSYVLYRSIRGPQEAFEEELALVDETRERMGYLRDAMRGYELEYNRYPSTLDSLVQAIKTDSFLVAKRDSIFQLEPGDTFDPDILAVSPRPGNDPFELTVVRDDSTGVRVYLIEDPYSDDYIGTDNPERAAGALNAASWE